ncbi:MAG: hypothetical protein ACM3SQ_20040 [Betaproteobacteria bacterium]
MEMFLMAAALSLLGVAVSAAVFAATVRDDQPPAIDLPRVVRAPEGQRFFVDPAILAPTGVPIEALLLQIERHVQLEQAAAESFFEDPTAESLHLPSMSPLVH